jgi:predicted nuclease of restriction endonuclease-like (RecB) superfamily
MSGNNQQFKISVSGERLLDRVVSILEQARANVVKAVNSNMIIAYWLIGREIVNEIQQGEERADYGKKVISNLSRNLTKKYGRGFSTTNLWYLRQFYIVYSDRNPEIPHKACGESFPPAKLHKACGELENAGKEKKNHKAAEVLEDMTLAIAKTSEIQGFSSALSWSHYRTLIKVEHKNERLFYEIEAEKEGWSVPHLQRQINTFLFARLLKSRDKVGVMRLTREGNKIETPSDVIKSPYILDFLGLPESEKLHELKLEQAIINNIQLFLLELGKGFAFVARQKRISTETKEFYIDLVFYNYHLKCFILVDLKTGELTHQDVGQMDMYVRMFDDLEKGKDDNPSVGLILCTEKDRAIVKYSVLNENKQLFASKYMLYLPSEQVLVQELEREKRLIEMEMEEKKYLTENTKDTEDGE